MIELLKNTAMGDHNCGLIRRTELKILLSISILALSILSLTGCATNFKIAYNTSDIAEEPAAPKMLIVNIQPFDDERQTIDENKVLFENGRYAVVNGKRSCVNSEEHYEEGAVPVQISNIIAEHLNQKHFFEKVVFNNKDIADYYISGKIKRFYGEQEISIADEVGAQFGLIGASVTSGIKTPAKIVIQITDLELHDNTGRVVQKFADINERYDESPRADSSCWSIYSNINEKLKITVEKLSQNIKTNSEKL